MGFDTFVDDDDNESEALVTKDAFGKNHAQLPPSGTFGFCMYYPGHPVSEIILCNNFHTVYVQSGMTPACKLAISEDPATQLENPMVHGTHINAKSGICSEGKKHTRAKQKKNNKKVNTVCQ